MGDYRKVIGQNDRMTIGDMFGGTTTHRLARRDGAEHRAAVFPTGAQATIALGSTSAALDHPELSTPAFELTSYLDEFTEGDRTIRATVVALVNDDVDKVEIVEGTIVCVADIPIPGQKDYDIGLTGVKFDDGTFVYMYDILSLRVEP